VKNMTSFSVVGKRIPKLDALDKVTGRVVYGHDLRLPGMLHGKILYSEQAHARVVRLDTSRARRLAGVKAVITAADNPPHKFGFARDNTPLKGDRVRCYADAVAAVAALDPDTADEALSLIEVEYEPLPAVFDPAEALADGAPLIHEDRGNNHFTRYEYRHGDVEQARAEADVIVDDSFELPYMSHAAMEPSFALASFDLRGRLTLHSTTQIPFLLQRDLADVLGMKGRDVRVIQTAIGGAFGRGLDMYPFEPIAALLARTSDRPVRIAFDRVEEFRAAPLRQPMRATLHAGARRDGKLLFRDVTALLDGGAYISWGVLSPVVMMLTFASLYRLPHARFVADVAYTNNPTTGAMRGFGNPQITFVIETAMDRLAEGLGMDPLEFRLLNANRPNEVTPQEVQITSCGLRECFMEAGETIGWERRKEAKAQEGGRLVRGIGVAATLNVGGGARIYRSDGCGAMVLVDDFGSVTLVTGATEIGQGSDVAQAQIVAEVLGIAPADVTVVNDDTAIRPWDVGVHASRTTFIAGHAARLAALDARRQIFETAAKMLEAEPERLVAGEGKVYVEGMPEQGMPLDKVVRSRHFRAGGQVVIGQGWYDPPTQLVDKDTYKGNISAAYGFGTQVVEVEVDLETGQVRPLRVVSAHDIGRAINPMAVEGQIEGGIHMGLGYALTEEVLVKEGQVLNPNFLDYRLHTAADMPEIESIIVETDDPEGPFGAKGVGEMGANAIAAAVANAVWDAIGVRITSLPITAEKVLRALSKE
jgi:CO/xanthine dehydrogenase Mo-binding subunit